MSGLSDHVAAALITATFAAFSAITVAAMGQGKDAAEKAEKTAAATGASTTLAVVDRAKLCADHLRNLRTYEANTNLPEREQAAVLHIMVENLASCRLRGKLDDRNSFDGVSDGTN